MSFGRITGHLMAARELAQRHDSATDSERFFVEVILMHIDLLLAITRAAHHRRTLCGGALITIAFAVALWLIVAWAAIRGALVPSTLHSHLRR